jgi:type I restriction enzyme, S subunit
MTGRQYSSYKDTGVDWLGTVPTHWTLKPLWVLYRRVKRVGFPHEQLLSVYRDHGVIPKASRDDNFNKPSDDLSTYQLVVAGDLCVNKMKAWQGSVGISEHRGIVSPAYFTYMSLHSEDRRYLHYLLRSARYITGYLTISKGIRVNQWDLEPVLHSRLPVVLPRQDEQVAIAAFLDRETTKIDALVAEQERLIELLKEKRQAVIFHAVTKGLNPDAPMKNSGHAWIGTVPAHWDIVKMKWVATMDSGHTPDKKIPEYWDGDFAWVSLNDTGYLKDHDYISDTAYRITELGMSNSSAHLLPKRAVVFSRDATIGRCAITTKPMAVSQHFIAWICGEMLVPEYLLLRLRSMEPELESLTTGATVRTIGMPEVRTLVTPLPPIDEQRAIVEHVATLTSQHDALMSEVGRAIFLMQERRSALISAAVTGQIDVRAAAARSAA